MADKKGITAPASKVAMSRALGAAFLNHQVEQLEKSVNNVPGSWRDRRQGSMEYCAQGGGRGGMGRDVAVKRPPAASSRAARRKAEEVGERDSVEVGENAERGHRRRSSDDPRVEKVGKDADVIVVDASVLIHALYQVKKWCREGRQEIVIVPLEALNTLDLLKKGITPLAQRARAASRILEAQVGTNPRIIVQRDDAFVLWDKIEFKDTAEIKDKQRVPLGPANGNSPEWVRRTICCARWEVDNAGNSGNSENGLQSDSNTKPKVVLAILSSPPPGSPTSRMLNLDNPMTPDTPLTPVPLPTPHAAKHEARSAGILVSHWAARAGIEMMEVAPTLPSGALSSSQGQTGKGFDDDDRGKRGNPHPRMTSSTRGRRPSHGMSSGNVVSGGGPGTGLVERPPAVMAMMEMVSQPRKVVRVLARGEKLDPDS